VELKDRKTGVVAKVKVANAVEEIARKLVMESR